MTDPHACAQRWVADWNAHQLPRILSHYSADCVLHSPTISKVLGTDTLLLMYQGLVDWARVHYALEGPT